MGNTLSYITGSKENLKQTSTQTEIQHREVSVQTAVTFSERLTHNNTVDLGSSEIFEETCVICETGGEKKAVGICKNCRQYMCFPCCKIHEKMAATKNHTICSKLEFGEEIKPKSLYSQNLAPIHCKSFYNDPIVKSKIGAIHVPNSDNFLFWVQSTRTYDYRTVYYCEIHYFNKTSGWASTAGIYLSEKESIGPTQDQCQKCYNIGYFVLVCDIYPNSVSNTTVYKYCLEHGKNVIPAFNLHGTCHSVVLFNGGLALSVYIKTGFSNPDWHIQLVDFKGNIIKQICYDGNGIPLFKEPRHLASSNTEDILFVSDYSLNSVLALDKHGQTLFKFTHKLISCPLGITCDEENNVYVACGQTVVQIKQDGKISRALLNSTEKKTTVEDVCYNELTKSLAVVENSPKATIFKFLP